VTGPTLVALGAGFILPFFLLVWLVARRIRNYSIVDIAWSAGVPVLAVLYAALGDGSAERRLLGAAMAATWGFRLAWHLSRRIRAAYPEEDGRYEELRRSWGDDSPKFLFFFLAQGGLDLLLATPFLLASLNTRPAIHPLEWAGIALLVVAVAGETIADRQLAAFKASAAGPGRVCRVGLWRYSRHPNYFFEWLVWVAFALFALPAPAGWLALGCPLLMLYFLFRVTGIPATEEQALRSKGDAYRQYQWTTSAFVPWFPRRTQGGGPAGSSQPGHSTGGA
jgi:steroid 5-alpha reductase family enzyme